MDKIKKIIEAHRFFVRESRLYAGKPKYDWLNDFYLNSENIRKDVSVHYSLSLRNKLYYPIAYLKFMYYSISTPNNN
mgnify:CR=1 FL=1